MSKEEFLAICLMKNSSTATYCTTHGFGSPSWACSEDEWTRCPAKSGDMIYNCNSNVIYLWDGNNWFVIDKKSDGCQG